MPNNPPEALNPNSPDYAGNPKVSPGHLHVATDVSGAVGTVTNPAVTSGVAFVPSATRPSTVTFQVNSASAGSYSLSFGPTTGTEHSVGATVAMVAGSDALVTLNVPVGWSVVLTLVTSTLGSTTVLAQ